MFSWKEIGRKNIRLTGYDYTRPGTYFVTICTWENREIFGSIQNGFMVPNELGIIAISDWLTLPIHRPYISLDEFVVMPNHVHAILCIEEGAASRAPTDATAISPSPPGVRARLAAPPSRLIANSLGAIINGYKSGVSRQINKIAKSRLPIWHVRFYDSIVKGAENLERIREYIRENPAKWERDRNNPNPHPVIN